jgi:hypothetical protein
MKVRAALSCAATATAATVSASVVDGTANSTTVTIEPSRSWGVWEGWGTSLAWYGNCYGQRDDLADAFFTLGDVPYQPDDASSPPSRSAGGPHASRVRSTAEATAAAAAAAAAAASPVAATIPGLGLTIARYNLGGASFAVLILVSASIFAESPNGPGGRAAHAACLSAVPVFWRSD